MTTKTLPPEVEKLLVEEDVLSYLKEFREISSKNFTLLRDESMAAYVVILPHHGWDLNESNFSLVNITVLQTKNLKKVQSAEVFGGPGFTVYEKTDDNLAWVAFVYQGDGNGAHVEYFSF